MAEGFPQCVYLSLHLWSDGRCAVLEYTHMSREISPSPRIQVRIWRGYGSLGIISDFPSTSAGKEYTYQMQHRAAQNTKNDEVDTPLHEV